MALDVRVDCKEKSCGGRKHDYGVKFDRLVSIQLELSITEQKLK